MGVLSKIAGRRTRRAKAAMPSSANVPSLRRISSSWLPSFLRGDYTLRNSELLFAAVSRISNALSTMPIQLYKGANKAKGALNNLNDFLRHEPNPNMTACQFIKTLEACRCTSGNGYAIKVYDPDGSLDRIDLLDPARVGPIVDTDSGELWYRVSPERGAEFYVHNYYVLHIPFLSTNGYAGVNPISVLYDTLSYSDEIEEFSVKQLKTGISSKAVLEAPTNLGEEQRKRLLKNFRETYIETGGNILLLESGITAKPFNLSPVDSKLFEVEKITRSKVAMVYNIPPHLLGDYSEAALKTQEQIMLQFLMLTMLPIVTAYEQELNRKLLTKEQRRGGYHFEFDMDAILRADAATQAEVFQKAIRGGWYTPNEIRVKYSLPPDRSGNKLLVSRDLTTLEYTVNNPDKGGGGTGPLKPEPEPNSDDDGEA